MPRRVTLLGSDPLDLPRSVRRTVRSGIIAIHIDFR
jgi:hypothetical protein